MKHVKLGCSPTIPARREVMTHPILVPYLFVYAHGSYIGDSGSPMGRGWGGVGQGGARQRFLALASHVDATCGCYVGDGVGWSMLTFTCTWKGCT